MNGDLLPALLEATPGWAAAREACGLDTADAAAVLAEAERFATGTLAPLAAPADRIGCRLEVGRVVTPPGYGEAYRALGEGGWIAPDLPEDFGGAGLPLALHTAASLHFEAAAMPFMMAAGASRAGAHLLAGAAPALAGDWVPALAAGRRTATIAISEPEAGSDVGRIRTRAVAQAGGGWRIDGTKCWISFGDHDLCALIGHLCLARTGPPETGTRGLSLFLVPNSCEGSAANGIVVERIEDKLGLAGSPTCVLRFDGARGELIGEEGRGLPALFAMIELMRLQTATQGAGIARAAAALAHRYAADRRQGGDPAAPPVAIRNHPDVRRQLTAIDAMAALATMLVLDVAVALAAGRDGDPAAAARAAFLLPVAKTIGGELAFDAASGAIQVLGGAGYTRDWPAERLLRDARIITIYEGTSGMQAQDLVSRRLVRDRGVGLAALLVAGRAELAACPPSAAVTGVGRLLDRLEALADELVAREPDSRALGADGFLRACWSAVGGLLACRLATGDTPAAHLGRFWLHGAAAAMAGAEAACRIDPADLTASD